MTRVTRTVDAGTDGSRERHRAVLETAARLICEKGYEAASVQDIAAACGLTKAGLYYYIRSKEDLLLEIQNEPRVAAFAFLGQVLWIYKWFRPDGKIPADRLVREMQNLFFGGLETAPSSKPAKPAKTPAARKKAARP